MTLVMYDMENIKVSKRNVSKVAKRFDILKLKNEIEDYCKDGFYKHVAFLSVYNNNTNNFQTMLKTNDFEIISKKSILKKADFNGMKYTYRDSDIDAKIVNYAHCYYKEYDTIVFVTGDGDMYTVMKRISNQKHLIVFGWKDNTARKIKDKFEYVSLDKLVKNNKI